MKKSGNDFLRVKNFFIINNSLFCSSAIKFSWFAKKQIKYLKIALQKH